jgi:hypothetical protein
MNGEKRNSQRGCAAHRSGNGIRDVVELEIEEDLFAAGDQIADERRANGGEELLADQKLTPSPSRRTSARAFSSLATSSATINRSLPFCILSG